MAGRPPKAIEARRQDGTYNPAKHGMALVLSDRKLPSEAPEDMSPLQQQLWLEIIPEVEVILQMSDLMSYRGMIVALSRAIEAGHDVDHNGINLNRDVINSRTGTVQTVIVVNPAVKIEQESWKLFQAYADRLGMSPVARAKLVGLGATALSAKEKLEKSIGPSPWDIPPTEEDSDA